MCYVCRKFIMFEPKKYRGVMYYNTEEWFKIWGGTDLCFEMRNVEFGMAWGIWRISSQHSKSLLLGSFWAKHIMFELNNYRGVMCPETEAWCNI